MAWIYLFIASLFEIAWTYSLKLLDMRKVGDIKWLYFFNNPAGLIVLLPLLGYIFFGLANIICFSAAIKSIPAATAFSVWMGITLIGLKIVDISIFKQPYHLSQFFFIALILVGIVGLKESS
ncbi:MAG: hypothetical protein H7Y86_14620 [Rhizobacter sp.]|nr:hypothetical protein [Ferruginibacter sp.]